MFSTESATLNLNTHKVVKLLQDKGYSEEQAEGFIEVIEEITLTGVATKQDLHLLRDELKADIIELRKELKADIIGLRNELKDDVLSVKGQLTESQNSLRNELKEDISSIKSQLTESQNSLRNELKEDMANLRTDLTKLIYINTITTIGILTAVIALFKLLG